MDRKSQALIIVLWILVILTVLAVSVGHRVALALRLSRYQKESLRAYYLARSAVNLAISRLLADNNSFDYLNEDWADNETLFRGNKIFGNDVEYITVAYNPGDGPGDIVYGCLDESSRININESSEEVLNALFSECGLDSSRSDNLAKEFLRWRGALPVTEDEDLDYKTSTGYIYKKERFMVPEEINLLKGIQELDNITLDKIRGFITVYGGSKAVNINTASLAVLNILARSTVGGVPGALDSDATFLAQQIINSRLTDKYPVENVDTAQMCVAFVVDQSSVPGKILNNMVTNGLLSVQSSFFRINASGIHNSVNKSIETVFYRHSPAASDNRIIEWHQN